MISWNWGPSAFIIYVFCEFVQYKLLLFTSNNFLYNSSGGQTEAHLRILLFPLCFVTISECQPCVSCAKE